MYKAFLLWRTRAPLPNTYWMLFLWGNHYTALKTSRSWTARALRWMMVTLTRSHVRWFEDVITLSVCKLVTGPVDRAVPVSVAPPPSPHHSLPEVPDSGSSSVTAKKVKKEKSEECPAFHTTSSTDSYVKQKGRRWCTHIWWEWQRSKPAQLLTKIQQSWVHAWWPLYHFWFWSPRFKLEGF